MSTSFYKTKSVTPQTTFDIVKLASAGKVDRVFRDNEGDIVGLVNRETPFIPIGLDHEIYDLMKKSLRIGANYKAYPASKFDHELYVLDVANEITDIESNDAFDDYSKKARDLSIEANDLYKQITGKDHPNSYIEGQYHEIT